MGKILIVVVATLGLIVWSVGSLVSSLLGDAPFLIRAVGIFFGVLLAFHLLGRLIRFGLTRAVTGFSGRLQTELNPTVEGELVECKWVAMNQWDQSGELELEPQRQDRALRIRLRFRGEAATRSSDRIDPAAFNFASTNLGEPFTGSSANFKMFSAGFPGQSGSIGDVFKAMSAGLGVQGQTADWVRLLDAQGRQLFSGQAQSPPSSTDSLPLISDESMVELVFSAPESERGNEFRVCYRLKQLFVLKLPIEDDPTDENQGRKPVTLIQD